MEGLKQKKKINLIPSDMAVPATSIKLARILNKISVWLAVLLVFLILIFGGYYYYLVTQNNSLITKTNNIKAEIESLVASEQKLVLAKDRIAKIGVVQKAKSIDNEIGRFKSFASLVASAGGSAITEANLSTKGTEVSIISDSTTSLANIISPLPDLKDYKNVVLTSLSLNTGTGYLLSLILEAQ